MATKLTISYLFALKDFLSSPGYAVPLVINLTGSLWFFLLLGELELSFAVPLANSLSFLFTILGEWYVESRAMSFASWIGCSMVVAGIALCVRSKT